jgi:ABC-type multidrug transport system fused ATPase/permease subunit
MMAVVPVLLIAVRYFAFAQRSGFREQRTWLSRINAYLNENITGMSVIQLFNRQKRNLQGFDDRNTGLLRANLRVLFYYAIFEPTVVLFTAVTTALILWYGGGRAIEESLSRRAAGGARQDRVPQRLVRLRGGELGAARRLLRPPAGRQGRDRRRNRRRQVDDDEPAQPLL